MRSALLALLSLISLVACARIPTKDNQLTISPLFTAFKTSSFLIQSPAKATEVAANLSGDDSKMISDDLDQLISVCQPIISGMETAAQKQSDEAFWLSISGLIAGAVIAPALTAANAHANAATIAAVSGYAGATNTASAFMSSNGLSGSSSAATRNQIIDNLNSKISVITNPQAQLIDIEKALIAARADCILYKIAVPTNTSKGAGGA